MISSSFTCIASESRFCVLWIRNTIRNVTIVVPVLITSCQVSLKPKTGPVTAHATMIDAAMMNVSGRPDACAVALVRRVNQLRGFVGRIVPPGALCGREVTGHEDRFPEA